MTETEITNLVARIRTNLALINNNLTTIETANPNMIDFIIRTTIDRIMLYLSTDTIPTIIERLIAEIVNGNLARILDKKADDGSDKQISSMSDNGQSISFTNDAKRYFATSSDDEIFSGYVAILNRYRKIRVVC